MSQEGKSVVTANHGDHSGQDQHVATVEKAADSHGASNENPLLKLDPGVGIWALITFFLLLLLLRKFAWGPIINALDERDRTINASLEKAEEARNESKKIATEQKSILAESRAEAGQIVSEAKKSAEEYRRKIEQGALDEKIKIVESAKEEITAMKNEAISQLRKTTVDLAIGAAEKLLEEKIDNDQSKKIVDNYIKSLED
ncbi:MAG: F0F1 ATP synthase subunit B [Fibrobacterales bacterium]